MGTGKSKYSEISILISIFAHHHLVDGYKRGIVTRKSHLNPIAIFITYKQRINQKLLLSTLHHEQAHQPALIPIGLLLSCGSDSSCVNSISIESQVTPRLYLFLHKRDSNSSASDSKWWSWRYVYINSGSLIVHSWKKFDPSSFNSPLCFALAHWLQCHAYLISQPMRQWKFPDIILCLTWLEKY